MALPACTRCGKTDPRRMIGLMTLWFGPFVELPAAHGYFHLCPDCYREYVHPHLEKVRGKLAELHPLARQLGLHVDHGTDDADRPEDAGTEDAGTEDAGTEDAGTDPDTGSPVAAGAG